MALTFATIKTQVAAILRLDLNKSDQSSLVERWINDSVQDIHGRHDWNWAMERAIVQTVVDKTAGTVSVAAGGTTVTGSGTAFASSDVGSFIQFSTSDDWYKITAVASAISLTIEAAYVETTALSAGTYNLRKVFYTLSSAERILSVKQADSPAKIWPVHYRSLDEVLPFSEDTGTPTIYCLYGVDSSGGLKFVLNPNPDAVLNLEIRYKVKATEGDVTLIPEQYRSILVDGAIARGYEYVALGSGKEFDHNAIILKRNLYESGIQRMLAGAEPMEDWQPRIRNCDVQLSLPVPHLPETLSIPED